MRITRKIAEKIYLRDDETETGGISHSRETLAEFMGSVGLSFGSSRVKINKALKECGIEPVTTQEVLDAANPFTIEEEYVLEKVATQSGMDCWFGIDENGNVYDREGDVKSKTNQTRKVLVSQLIDGMIKETWDILSDYEQYTLVKCLGKILVS